MNRSPSHMKAPARPHARPRRGFAMLMAIGIIAFIAAAVVVSLRAVTSESALQGVERRNREAHFAAEAGLAEAREVIRLALAAGASVDFNAVIPALGNQYNSGLGAAGYVQETGLPSSADVTTRWYQVVPWTNYTLQAAPAGAAVDSDFATNSREMNGSDGRILDYPDQLNVRYRAFLVDDNDEAANDRSVDANNRVWLVAVGEVTGRTGTQPQRVIIRSLITGTTGTGGGCSPEDANSADNTGGC